MPSALFHSIIALSIWLLFPSPTCAQKITDSVQNSARGVLIICGEGLIPSYPDPKLSAVALNTAETFASALQRQLEKNGTHAELFVNRNKSLTAKDYFDKLLFQNRRDVLIQVVFGHKKDSNANSLYLEVSYMKLMYSSDQGKSSINIDHGPKMRYILAGKGASEKELPVAHYAEEFAKTLQDAGFLSRSTSTRSEPKLINYQTEGNLESTLNVDCVDITTLNSKYTPADLYRGVAKCIDAQNYHLAADLYALAGTYGRFDSLRVVDKTAHQAIKALQFENITPLDEKKRMAFLNTMKIDVEKGSASLRTVCNKIKKIGPPAYYPRYMVQHGMDAVMGELRDKVGVRGKDSGNAIQDNFNSEEAWSSVLKDYLHCPDM